MAGEEHLESCQECGATIYPEHLEKQVAEQWEGKLLCPFCLRQKRGGNGGAGHQASHAVGTSGRSPSEEPIALVDVAETSIAYDRKPTAIRSIGGGPGGMSEGFGPDTEKLRRPMLKGSTNATRCRTFHCKLADGPIAHLNDQINSWADADDNIEIKFATTTIGVIEGKHVDPHLIVTVFY